MESIFISQDFFYFTNDMLIKCKGSANFITKSQRAHEKMGLKQNIKKNKLMTTGRITSLNNDNEDIELMDSFCLLGSSSKNRRYVID